MKIELNDEEKALVKSGEIIRAIKSLRMRLDIALIDAKHAVDEYRGIRVHPIVPMDLEEALGVIKELNDSIVFLRELVTDPIARQHHNDRLRKSADFVDKIKHKYGIEEI